MLNNKNELLPQLIRLGLTRDEAKVYIEILKKPLSHLEIARQTGINRTKVYRIADELAKKSLITHSTQDEGRLLRANDPKQLEIGIVSQEEHLKAQRKVYGAVLPVLESTFKNTLSGDKRFTVKTYEGIAGFKQMLWNELETKGEILIFGNGTLEDLIISRLWAEKHRQRTTEAGYSIKEITNPGEKPVNFTKNNEFIDKHFTPRRINPNILPISQQMCIYNDTVAVFHWKQEQKVGLEVINKQFAETQRAIFKNYWKIAK